MNVKRFLFAFVTCLLVTCASQSVKRESSSSKSKITSTENKFRITTQIKEWYEIKNTYMEFDANGLYDVIDGGADLYIESGLQKGTCQSVQSVAGERCDIFAEDFGSTAAATKMFKLKKGTVTGPVLISRPDSENVVAEEFIGGVAVYFHKNNYYFELTLSGFAGKEQAIQTAFLFMEYLSTL
jgi:hypothetical protein